MLVNNNYAKKLGSAKICKRIKAFTTLYFRAYLYGGRQTQVPESTGAQGHSGRVRISIRREDLCLHDTR